MLITGIILIEVSVIILVICFRRKINKAVERWFKQNRFFLFVLLVLILLFVSVDLRLFFPNEMVNAKGIISKLAEWIFSLIS